MERGFIFTSAPFASCHASTLVEVGPGELIAAWFGGTREGAEDVAIWSSRLGRRGWSDPAVVADESGMPCWNPVLFREQRSGTLFLFYRAGPSPQTWSGFVKTSNDGGVTWSEAALLPAGLLGPVKNKPLQLGQGRIIAGTSVESYRAWAAWVEVSDDGGLTWSRRGPIVVPGEPRGVIQPAIYGAGDGRIRMLLRSTRAVGRVCASESRDRGDTWTPATPTGLANPNSGLDAVRLADGRVVLCHNPAPTGRTPLVLSVSEDEGDTWREGVVLESGEGEYSYPAVIQAGDGSVHVTYTWLRERMAHAVVRPEAL